MTALLPLPAQPADVPWPTESWPEAPLPKDADADAIHQLLDRAFGDTIDPALGETHSLVIVKDGAIVAERYGEGFSASDTYPSWSMAKSMTQALIGILVKDGKIDIQAPAAVPEWQGADDPRKAITLDQLLRMSSGLAFREEYVADNPSDVIEMLWGAGKEDAGHFAASFDLEHDPDTFWSYSSGTTNIVARIAAEAFGEKGAPFEAFMRERLFDVIGMKSPLPKFDGTGVFIGSSFCYCTARDFARFGTLYLRDGIWDGQRLLPEGWVDYARTPTPQTPAMIEEHGAYGAHWWLGLGGEGSFSANGFEGQFTIVAPDLNLVLVRNGKTPADLGPNVKKWMADLIDGFRA